MRFEKSNPVAAGTDGSAITDGEAAALGRAVVNLFREWKLRDEEACVLLGGMNCGDWARWKAGDIGLPGQDLRFRMAVLMGIHRGLRCLFIDPMRGYNWIRKSNKAFDGHSALDIMMRGKIEDLIGVRSYLDPERGVS